MRPVIFVIIMVFSFVGCTDTQQASLSAYGKNGHIKCYSGGKLILDAESSGRISATSQSDGWEFKDSKTGKFIRVSCDCVIEN